MRWLERIRGTGNQSATRKSPNQAAAGASEKVATTPLMLAVSISYLTSTMLMGILRRFEEDKPKMGGPALTADAIKLAYRQLLCALYCVAVVILGESDAACRMGTEPGGQYHLYTAATFQEFWKPSSPIWIDTDRAWQPLGLKAADFLDPKLLRAACDEATSLYLHDRPDLATLAKSARRFCYRATQVDPALKSGNWSMMFNIKAWIRFARALDLTNEEPQFLLTYTEFSCGILGAIDVLKKIQPAFSAE